MLLRKYAYNVTPCSQYWILVWNDSPKVFNYKLYLYHWIPLTILYWNALFKNTFYHTKAFSFQWWHLRAYNTAILLLCSPHLHQKYIFYLCVLFRQNTAKNLLCLHMNSDVVVVLCIICINWYIYFIRIIYLIFWTITELMQPIKKYSGPTIII